MILLDVIDAQEKLAQEQQQVEASQLPSVTLTRTTRTRSVRRNRSRETLPPYTIAASAPPWQYQQSRQNYSSTSTITPSNFQSNGIPIHVRPPEPPDHQRNCNGIVNGNQQRWQRCTQQLLHPSSAPPPHLSSSHPRIPPSLALSPSRCSNAIPVSPPCSRSAGLTAATGSGYLHPRAASSPSYVSETYARSPASSSTRTLVPPSPHASINSSTSGTSSTSTLFSPSPSSQSFLIPPSFSDTSSQRYPSTLSLPFISSLDADHPPLIASNMNMDDPCTSSTNGKESDTKSRRRSAPSDALRPANHVHVVRRTAPIMGTYVLDPALHVPDCLLPEQIFQMPAMLFKSMSTASKGDEKEGWDYGYDEKGKGKGTPERKARYNLSLMSNSGDICADVWVREGCSTAVSQRERRPGRRRRQNSDDSSESVDVEPDAEDYDPAFKAYWESGWESQDTGETWFPPPNPGGVGRAELIAKSEGGSVMLKLHAPRSQRFRLYAFSTEGSVTVGVPRTFNGPIFTSTCVDLVDGTCAPKLKRRKNSSDDWISDAQTQNNAPPPPLQISPEMEDRVAELTERKNPRGLYFVGDTRRWRTLNEGYDWDGDELHLASRTGSIGICFNTEPLTLLPKSSSSNLIRVTKFLSKHL